MTPGVDFFRVDRRRPTRRSIAFAIAAVLIGASAIGAQIVRGLPPATARGVSIFGSIVMVSGLLVGFGTLARMLFENVYLAIRPEGVRLHDNGTDIDIAWDALEGATAASGLVTLARKEAAPVVFHAGRGASELVAKVEEARRKAAFFRRA